MKTIGKDLAIKKLQELLILIDRKRAGENLNDQIGELYGEMEELIRFKTS